MKILVLAHAKFGHNIEITNVKSKLKLQEQLITRVTYFFCSASFSSNQLFNFSVPFITLQVRNHNKKEKNKNILQVMHQF